MSSPSIKYTTTNINTSTAANIPIFGSMSWNDNNTIYTSATSTSITIEKAGRYQIICNLSLVGVNSSGNSKQRTGVEAYLAVNGAQAGAYASSSYIRFANGHNTSSLHINETIQLAVGDVVSIQSIRGANSGAVRLRGNNRSNIVIKKIK